jgi:cbb3-type cytochrome oxidase subunit 3
MIKEVARNIPNIEVYPIISLSIFFLFFLGLGWYVIRAKKEEMNQKKNIPLEDETNEF